MRGSILKQMSFDDDFDVPLTNDVKQISDFDDVDIAISRKVEISEHFYTVYPYYFNSNKLPKYIRDTYNGVDITIHHLVRTLPLIGHRYQVELKRHPADLFHSGRLKVFTLKPKRQLLFDIAKNLHYCFEQYDREYEQLKQMATAGDTTKDDFLLSIDPFYVPTAMRSKDKQPVSKPSKKSKKKKK